jgi:hypothetical protein
MLHDAIDERRRCAPDAASPCHAMSDAGWVHLPSPLSQLISSTTDDRQRQMLLLLASDRAGAAIRRSPMTMLLPAATPHRQRPGYRHHPTPSPRTLR